MKTVKNQILRLLGCCQIPRNFIFGHFRGIGFDSSWRFYGLPWIRVGGRGSTISIGRNFTAGSKLSRNSFGIIQRVMIRTVGIGAKIVIGDYVGVSGCTITACRSVHIGNRVLIGSGAVIVDYDAHPIHPEERLNGCGEVAPVVIEDDVFVGARAIILKGVTIGKGSVVGAGTVVAKSIPPYSIAIGNPVRIIGDSRKYSRKDAVAICHTSTRN